MLVANRIPFIKKEGELNKSMSRLRKWSTLILSSNAELVCTINLAKFIANILYINYLKKANSYKLIAVSYLPINSLIESSTQWQAYILVRHQK
jgi:hypothetical protein